MVAARGGVAGVAGVAEHLHPGGCVAGEQHPEHQPDHSQGEGDDEEVLPAPGRPPPSGHPVKLRRHLGEVLGQRLRQRGRARLGRVVHARWSAVAATGPRNRHPGEDERRIEERRARGRQPTGATCHRPR
jgi:hypothetical protein